MIRTTDIFEISNLSDKVICPPDQVFKNKEFDFLITRGGHLVENNLQYQMFMKLLKENGEQEFTIRENLGATITERTKPFETFSVDSTLDVFDNKIKEFDKYFGLTPWHWFVHGQKENWGIYISEYPTVIIIGCDQNLTRKFRMVFNVIDNGYKQEKEFLDKEFSVSKDSDFKRQFLDNYKIKNAPQHKNKSH